MRILCLIIAILTASCGSRSYNVQQKPSAPFKTFGQVVVEPFKVDGEEKLGLTEKPKALEVAAQMTQYLKERLEGKKWFKEGGQTLTIKGLVVGYDPGSQAMRYLVGFGAGSGEIIVDTVFSDASGTQVARANARGSVSGGLFGGSTSSACDRVAKAIIDFIKANYDKLE
jgi:hypothetical protein